MVIHPDIQWLYEVYDDVYDDRTRRERLDEIRQSLHYYISYIEHIFVVTDILNLCFDDLMGQGYYTTLIELYRMIIHVFDGDIPIYDVRDHYEMPPIGATNAGRFPTEYFVLKRNYAHAILMRHSLHEVQQHLHELRNLIPTVGYEYQLSAYYLFLKYISFDHTQEIESNIIEKIENLLRNNSHLALEAYIAIGYYYYNKGDINSMKHLVQRITRKLAQTRSYYPEEISKITAEQYLYLAIMYRDLRKYDEALTYFDIALDQASRIDHSIHTMLILAEKALVYSFKGDIEEAQSWITLAVKKFENLPETQGYQEAHIEHTRGLIAYYAQDFETALFSFQRVLPIWEAYEREYHIALANNAIGSTLIKLKRPEEAIQYLKLAEVICKPLDDKWYAHDLLNIINTNLNEANDMLHD